MSEYFTSCLICGSEKRNPLKKYEDAFLVKCCNCGFVFSNKKPSEQELINHYKNYPNETQISDITIKRYNELLNKFEKFRRNNNILDVGCGDGFFLDQAKKRNWNVYGTEFREQAVKKCSEKGINMKQGKLSSLNYTPDFFDVITSFEVIEHINNPTEEISAFNKILRQGGAVYITTPNFNSLSRHVLGNKWNVIEYPEHLCYYTISTLKNLFWKYNFRMTAHETTGISFSRFIRSINKNNSSASVFQNDEAIRKKIEGNSFLILIKKKNNSFLTLTGTGDSIKVFFVKSGQDTAD